MKEKSVVRQIRLPVVNSLRETLSDYVRRVINEKGLNYREVARLSGAISHATVGDIVNGIPRNYGTDTLRALAKGLGVPEDELFAAARGKKPKDGLTPEEMHLLHCFRGIPSERQSDVLGYLELLYTRYGSYDDEDADMRPPASGAASRILPARVHEDPHASRQAKRNRR